MILKMIPDIKAPFFSFNYNGKPFNEYQPKPVQTHTIENNLDIVRFEYSLPDGLVVTQILTVYKKHNAMHWLLNFENKADTATGILSDICDSDICFPFDYDSNPTPGYIVEKSTARLIRTVGSNWERAEFNPKDEYILPNTNHRYSAVEGRSSQGLAPFFDINRGDCGVLVAVGWTGQWQAAFTRGAKDITVKTGIEALNFKLLPKEKIRTSSVIYLEYSDGQNNGHNLFRRLIKEHFSLIGKPGRPKQGPFCTFGWGGVSSDKMISRIKDMAKHDFGYEYYWVDAGWYGESKNPCPDEFTGDWGMHTGNWAVNKNYHPDELVEVSKTAKENGLKFLLWIEPERVYKQTPTPTAHPEWFFKLKDNDVWLLNLGDEDALNGTIEIISDIIKKLDIGCYRQDFNTNPLSYWRSNDLSERNGINEIKHITGLYRFWDTLLERFPNMIIDNCASGGRRIDIETLQRSIPLWRSDYQCVWNNDSETTQCHNTGISWWLPYSGTGTGNVINDTYRVRSAYSGAMLENYWGYEKWEFSETQPLDWVERINRVY